MAKRKSRAKSKPTSEPQPQPQSKDLAVEADRLRQQGWTRGDIARELNVNEETARDLINEGRSRR